MVGARNLGHWSDDPKHPCLARCELMLSNGVVVPQLSQER